MSLYFFGLDQYNCLIDDSQGKALQYVGIPTKLEGFSRVEMRLHLCVFKKVGVEAVWFVKGLGIPNVVELFPGDLDISEVCMASKRIIGLNKDTNALYKVDFEIDLDNEMLTWSTKKVIQPDPAIVIIQILSNDENIYCLDDRSGVYEINEGLVLKWRLGVQVVKIACGFSHFVAISDCGALYSWGSGGRGELGHTDFDHVMVNCEVPKRIDFFDDLPSIVKDISCGGWHTLALTSDGDVYSWGWNESGQLGHSGEKLSSISGQPYPIDLGSADDPIVDISAGARHSIALLKSGKVFSWGLNKHGQLGIEDFKNSQEPTEVKNMVVLKPFKVVCGRWSSFIYTV